MASKQLHILTFFLLYSNVYIWPLKANLPRPYISVLYDEFLLIFKCIIFAKKYYVYKSPCVNFKVTASKSGCMHGTRRNKQNKVYYNDRKHEWLWLIPCLLVTIFAIFFKTKTIQLSIRIIKGSKSKMASIDY